MAMVVKKCNPFRIEIVVRGYLAGTTSTSIWINYHNGVRDYCGHHLPEGLKQNQKLEKNIVTPTTKEEKDRLITPTEIVTEGWMTQEEWDYCSKKVLELFEYGQTVALQRGLILVDTKYEMGTDSDGQIILIDEIHTPDCSRYWKASSYPDRFKNEQTPETIDKDILRRWYNNNSDPNRDKVLPNPPHDLVLQLSTTYIQLYELITESKFAIQAPDTLSIHDRLEKNLRSSPYVNFSHTKKAVFISSSVKDKVFFDPVIEELNHYGLSYVKHVLSLDEPSKILNTLQHYENIKKESNGSVVYIVDDARLSEFVEKNSTFPTIYHNDKRPSTSIKEILFNIYLAK